MHCKTLKIQNSIFHSTGRLHSTGIVFNPQVATLSSSCCASTGDTDTMFLQTPQHEIMLKAPPGKCIYTVSQKKTWCLTSCDNFINC